MGRLFCDADFRRAVIDRTFRNHKDTGEYFKPYDGFPYADSCIFAAAYKKGIPTCVHAMLGTDIIDQHPSFDGTAKGGASGTDFLVFTKEKVFGGTGFYFQGLHHETLVPFYQAVVQELDA